MEKKVPLRRCVGCGEHKPKKELVRIVRDTDGGFGVGLTGKKNGRGAYICKSEQCVAKCAKYKILNRQLGETDEEVYAELKDKI